MLILFFQNSEKNVSKRRIKKMFEDEKEKVLASLDKKGIVYPTGNSKSGYPSGNSPTDYSTKTETRAVKANCPDCDAFLDVPKDVEKGEILSCPGCGLELEVKAKKGESVDLQELTIEGEDWGE